MRLFTKAACFGISLLLIFTLGITVNTKVLRAANFCGIDEEPQFYFGIAYLKSLLGPVMGDPVECEHANPANGDALQHTTTGLAFYRKATNTPTFTDGWTHWAWTENGLVTWVGDSIDPPNIKPSTSISDGLQVLLDWEEAVPSLIGINDLFREMEGRIKFMDLSGNALGSYFPRSKLIGLNENLQRETPAVLSMVLAHEGQHALDHHLGHLIGNATSCFAAELRAFDVQIRLWQAMWGDDGLGEEATDHERMFNYILWVKLNVPALYRSTIVELYEEQCR